MCNLNVAELQSVLFCFLTALAVAAEVEDTVSGPSSVPQHNINETNEHEVREQDVNRQDASVGEGGALGKAILIFLPLPTLFWG